MIGWVGFIASIIIALIVGSIFKVFREARGGNFFAALLGSQLGIFLVNGASRFAKGVVGILCAIVVSWLLSLGMENSSEETISDDTSSETPK